MPITARSLLRFAHKISKNRLQGACESTVRFTLQTHKAAPKIGIFVTFFAKKVTKTYKCNRTEGPRLLAKPQPEPPSGGVPSMAGARKQTC
jgi:hypothetical protein